MRKLLSAIASLFLLALPAQAAITLNGSGGIASGTAAANSLTLTATINVPTGTNEVLVIGVGIAGGNQPSQACTWDYTGGSPQPMYSIPNTNSATSGGGATFYGLRAPHTGTLDFQCTWTGGGSSTGTIAWATFNGVDQTADITTFVNGNSNTGGAGVTPLTVTVTNVANGAVVVYVGDLCCTLITNTGTQSTIQNSSSFAVGGALAWIGPTGAGSLSDSWTLNGAGGPWWDIGFSLLPAGGSSHPSSIMMMGQ